MSKNEKEILYALLYVETCEVVQYDYDYDKLSKIAETLNAYWIEHGKPVKYTVINFN